MTIKEIAEKINQKASAHENLKDLQSYRAGLKGMERPRTYKLFSNATIFDGDDGYAFHDGGRSELQFNIGVEYLEDQELLRYGVAFSLEPNQSQPDPINFLTPKIHAFNQFFQENTGFFDDLLLWHYREAGANGRSADFLASTIPDSWITWGNFIFIGKYFAVSIDEITDDHISEIVRLFDYLITLFKYVESNYSNYRLPVDGNRISRICWNKYGWVKPSGRERKSNDPDTHEGQYGYGHEEWLGDISKTIGGYHYGFLESVRKEQDAFAGKKYNVDLFTIDGITSKRYYVGNIMSLEVIEPVVASTIKNEYLQRGWLDLMKNQIIEAGANDQGFSEWNGIDLFNVRFKPEDLHFFANYLPTNDENILKITRYSFTHKSQEIISAIPVNSEFLFTPEPGIPIDGNGDIETSEYQREAKPIEITYLHKKIRNALCQVLVEKYGNCVRRENPTGQGTLIDLVRQDGETMIFYEIKTYYNIKSCIREALGQLLEYAFWPGVQNAHELIVVSQNQITDDCKKYLEMIRRLYNLPIYYQHFDIDNNILSEKY